MTSARVFVNVVQQQGVTPIWAVNHETGDYVTSGWQGGPGPGKWRPSTTGDASIKFVTNPVHGGRYALRMTINTSGGKAAVRLPLNRLYVDGKETLLPDQAYYSCWYYIPPGITQPAGSWNIMQWKTAYTKPNGSNDSYPVYSVNCLANGSRYYFTLYDKMGDDGVYNARPGTGTAASTKGALEVSPNTWFHLEVNYKWSTRKDGFVRMWVNGQSGWNIQNVATQFDPDLNSGWESFEGPAARVRQWSVNNYSNKLSPNPVSIYVDDAVIAKERVYGKSVIGL